MAASSDSGVEVSQHRHPPRRERILERSPYSAEAKVSKEEAEAERMLREQLKATSVVERCAKGSYAVCGCCVLHFNSKV